MPATQLVTAAIEQAINSLLKTQPHGQAALAKLQGKRLVVFLDIFSGGLSLVFDDRVLVLREMGSFEQASEHLDAHSCFIKTKVSVLGKLSQTNHITALIQNGDLNLIGDIAIAQHVSDMLSAANVDLEEALAQKTSDVFAHTVFSAVSGFHQKATSVLSALSIQGGELITEEKPIAARKQAVRGFAMQVSTLRDDVERFAAKLDKFEQAQNHKEA